MLPRPYARAFTVRAPIEERVGIPWTFVRTKYYGTHLIKVEYVLEEILFLDNYDAPELLIIISH